MDKTRAAEVKQKRKFWEAHLKRWEASGISQSAYCRQNQLRLNRFIYWKKRRSPEQCRVSLVEWPAPRQEAHPSGSWGSLLCVVIGSRYRIEIQAGFDPALLENVVRVLRIL
jgi:hypothetical protein